MKKLTTILLTLSLSLPVFAQKYLQADVNNEDMVNSVIRNPQVGYGYCQDNQVILLNKMIDQSKKNINKTAHAIDEANRLHAHNLKLIFYRRNLFNQLVNQITLIKMRNQLINKGLYNLILASKKSKKPSILQLENLKFDVEVELMTALQRSISKSNWERFGEGTREFLKEEIYKELLSSVAEGAYKVAVSSALRRQIERYLAGQISRQIINQSIKSTLLGLGKSLVMEVGIGAIIEILTLPLHSYMLPPEGQLLEYVQEAPDLLINPEWINLAGSKIPPEYAWKSHCLMILRRPVRVETIFNELLIWKRKQFNEELSRLRD